jgi:hypothetical protein
MHASWTPFKNKWGQSKNVVLDFLVPVIMVFGYSVWLQRRKRNSDTTKTDSNTERKITKDPFGCSPDSWLAMQYPYDLWGECRSAI